MPPLRHQGFKIVHLYTEGHKILGTNTFELTDLQDDLDRIYLSVLIGPNGTGKSEIFNVLITILRNINEVLNGKKKVFPITGSYYLHFVNNGKRYYFGNIIPPHILKLIGPRTGRKRLFYFLCDKQVLNLTVSHDLELAKNSFPRGITAVSQLLTDKFYVPTNSKNKVPFPQYNYLGVRNRPQQASTRAYTRKTVEFIANGVESSAFRKNLNEVCDVLGFAKGVVISYSTSQTSKFYTGDISWAYIDEYFISIVEKYEKDGKIPPFKVNHYKKLLKTPGRIEQLRDRMNALVNQKRLAEREPKKQRRTLSYALRDDEDFALLQSEFQDIDDLRALGLMTGPEILVSKDEVQVGLQWTSSGEYYFLSTMVGIMATIKSHGLVLIDEPEISLHPNWQMQYIDFLTKMLSHEAYAKSHVIIATHSHFLISDLQATNSRVLGLYRDNGDLKVRHFDQETFGWSAEETLLEIFRVPTTRNYYLADRLGQIIEEIAKGDKRDLQQIENWVAELKARNIDQLSEADPLKPIIAKILKRYG